MVLVAVLQLEHNQIIVDYMLVGYIPVSYMLIDNILVGYMIQKKKLKIFVMPKEVNLTHL